MKLLIDISDEHYKNICKRAEYFGKRSIVLAPHEKAIANGIPFEDIKVEVQNTILEQTYEKGQIDILEKLKAEIKDLDLEFFDEDYRVGVARGIMEFNKILNNHISELKGENK